MCVTKRIFFCSFFLLFFSVALLPQERFLPISESELGRLEAILVEQEQLLAQRSEQVKGLKELLLRQEEQARSLRELSSRQEKQLATLSAQLRELMSSQLSTQSYIERLRKSSQEYDAVALSRIAGLQSKADKLQAERAVYRKIAVGGYALFVLSCIVLFFILKFRK